MLRIDLFRWVALSGVLFVILGVIGFALSVSVNLYEDDIAVMLDDVNDSKDAFQAGSVLAVAGMFFLIPLLVGVMYTHRDDDRPAAVAASLFLAVSLAGAVLSGITAVALGELAPEYASASGSVKDALLQDGRLLQDVYMMAFGPAFFFPLGLALAITGVLMLRAQFFARPVAWLTLIVAIGGLSAGILWPIVIIGLPIWSIAVAWTLWSKSSGAPAGRMSTSTA